MPPAPEQGYRAIYWAPGYDTSPHMACQADFAGVSLVLSQQPVTDAASAVLSGPGAPARPLTSPGGGVRMALGNPHVNMEEPQP